MSLFSIQFYNRLALPLAIVALTASATVLESRLDNGLALTPPMGWNSYNHYSCAPNEAIVHSNAQALVDLGLADLGYNYVTVDCGWTLPDRTANGTLAVNPDRFPSGYSRLGDFIHGLKLKFGVYSDGGIKMCMTGSPAQAGSLAYETVDAQTFASWGADLLKYDNCYSDAATGYPNTQYAPSTSPKSHYVTMSNAVLATGRKVLLQICDWGVDFPALWAPALGNTFRVTNDIIPAYRTIPRILNQIVPQTDFGGPGHWLDLDMLEVGNGFFTVPEEQTHFSLWAICKSPLTIGAALKDSVTSIKAESLAVLKNRDVISYNQDSLGVSASFRRRWTDDGYELWAGPLSGSRTVVALVNNQNVARSLTLDLPDVGLQTAGVLKDIWNNVTLTNVLTSYTARVNAHGTLLLELGSTTAVGEYGQNFMTSDKSSTTFRSIYGATSSSNYSVTISFSATSTSDTTFDVVSSASILKTSHVLPKSSSRVTISVALLASNSNTITITSSVRPSQLSIKNAGSVYYSSTSFTPSNGASLRACHSGSCLPSGFKIGNILPSSSATLSISPPASLNQSSAITASGKKFVKLYFINNDIALATSWTTGTNTRNITLTVNGVTTRVETPLSGRSSELYSPGLGWEDTGIMGVVVTGWKDGANVVSVGNVGGEKGIQTYAADFVGLEVFW